MTTQKQTSRAVVIGQGYVGLPVAVCAAEAGWNVVGIDLDPYRVEVLRRGQSPVEDISDTRLKNVIEAGRYAVSNDYAAASDFDVAVISVPTPLRETRPDLSYIENAAHALAPYIKPGATVILESTTYPGTTEELLIPILERDSGKKAGVDFHVGYSPERIDPGNPTYGLQETPKIVSGIDGASLEKVKEFFDSFIERTVSVCGTREAELAKLLENTFRHVNIALVNEVAQFAHQLGINVWEAIDAAATKPFGFMKFKPGPGVGGHCLPIDPSYLSWQIESQLGHDFRFVDLANDINNHMPDYVVQRVQDLLNLHEKSLKNATVLLLGVSYKPNTGDVREAPARRIAELLRARGAQVTAVDPFVSDRNWPADVERWHLGAHKEEDWHQAATADLVILINDHEGIDLEKVADLGIPILDTRNVMPEVQNVTRL